jgi:hypothetical protein
MAKLGGDIWGDEQGNCSERTRRAHVEGAGMEQHRV